MSAQVSHDDKEPPVPHCNQIGSLSAVDNEDDCDIDAVLLRSTEHASDSTISDVRAIHVSSVDGAREMGSYIDDAIEQWNFNHQRALRPFDYPIRN